MARRLSTEAVLEELEHDDDLDADEPMMAGSNDEFDDIEDGDIGVRVKDQEGREPELQLCVSLGGGWGGAAPLLSSSSSSPSLLSAH